MTTMQDDREIDLQPSTFTRHLLVLSTFKLNSKRRKQGKSSKTKTVKVSNLSGREAEVTQPAKVLAEGQEPRPRRWKRGWMPSR